MVLILNRVIALAIVLTISLFLSMTMTEEQPPSSVNNSLIKKSKIDTISNTTSIIFDGTTLDGWRMAGSGNFAISGNNTLESGGEGIFWYAKKSMKILYSN